MNLAVDHYNLQARQRIAGGRGFRAPFEFYPTPPEAVRGLLSQETFNGSIWEPACGDGAISKVLVEAGYQVVSSDLVDYSYGIVGVDFLRQSRAQAKNIVTNPPYGAGLADKFVKKALELTAETGGSVAMLLNLASLSHPDRHELFVTHPPSNVYVIDRLICWPCGKPELANWSTAKQRYCWLVWKSGCAGQPRLWWLKMEDFK